LSTSGPAKHSKASSSSGAIIGAVVGCIVGLAVVVIVFLVIRHHRKHTVGFAREPETIEMQTVNGLKSLIYFILILRSDVRLSAAHGGQPARPGI
jgi:hypothetical protein